MVCAQDIEYIPLSSSFLEENLIMDISNNTKEYIEKLKKRSKRCVCKYCGKSLKIKNILIAEFLEARIELYCDNCERIEYGVEPEIYSSAKYFVEEIGFNAYPTLDISDATVQMNIAKVCEIISWGCKNLGYLDDGGYVVAPIFSYINSSEATIFKDEDLVQKH